MKHTEAVAIAAVEELPVGRPVAASHGEVKLAVLRLDDEVCVFQGACPHQGTSLAEGRVEGPSLVCAGHQWTFDVRTGERVDRPGRCLHRFESSVHDGRVWVSAEELKRWAARERDASPHRPSGRPGVRQIRDLPGPRGLPLVGNLFSLKVERLHNILEGWGREFGSTYTFRLPQGPVVVLCDPETIRAVLRDRPETFRRIRTFEPLFRELGGHGVFSEEGDTWRKQRRLVTPALNSVQLRGFHDSLTEILLRLKARWERAAAQGAVVDIQEDMVRFTVDVTTNLAFGVDLNTLDGNESEIQRHLELLLPRIMDRTLAPFPYWRYVRLPKDRAADRASAALRVFVADLVARARERLKSSAEPPRNFLEALVAAQDEDGAGLSDEEVFGNVVTMLLAGEDTTANTLAWIVHFLCEYPEVQRRVQEEADAVLGDASTLPSTRTAAQLCYIGAVTQEAMRLRPVGPIFFLEPTVDVEVEGVAVPAGTAIYLVMNRGPLDAENFARPTEFNPDRWLGEAEGAHNPETLMPFGHGPRFCPGRGLAMLEIAAVVAMLCRRFEVRKIENHPVVEEQFGFTMHPSPIHVRFEVRES